MAFGDHKGSLTGTAASITNPFAVSTGGPVTVAAGDLIVAVLAQQTALTVTACSDNLGNTYTAQNAGTDNGNATGRAFYAFVTFPGSLSSVSFTTTASANDVAAGASVFEGPFLPSALDANPANAQDLVSPFSCPTTPTLAQADELVVAWASMNAGVTTWAATSPNTLRFNVATANIGAAVGSQVVSATTAVTPAFTNATNPTSDVLGTISFKKFVRATRRWRYNFNDLTKVWTTSSRTTNVSAAGDPIGYVDDAYGTGLDVQQATSSARPTLRFDSGRGRYYAELDGSDDYLESISATTYLNQDEFAFFAAALENSHPIGCNIFGAQGTGGSDWASASGINASFDATTFYIYANDTSQAASATATLASSPAPFNVYELYKTTTSVTALIGGSAGTADTTFALFAASNGGYRIGSGYVISTGVPGALLTGRIYSLEFDGTPAISSGTRDTLRNFHSAGSTNPVAKIVELSQRACVRAAFW